jgi:MFS family permease
MRAWHRSITLFFAFFGVAWASWAVRLPEIKTLIGASTAELGIILLVGAVGSLSALVISNRVIERFGTKPVIQFGAALFILALAAAAFSASMHNALGVAIFAFFLGFGVGVADVAQNVDGSQLEQLEGRSLMPRLHAAYSLGTLIGAGYGSLGAWLHFEIQWQTWALVPMGAILLYFTSRHLPTGTGKVTQTAKTPSTSPAASGLIRFFTANLFLIGVGIFATTLVEGASNDWLALSLVEDYKASPASAGVGYAFLVGAMTITRFFGGNLVDRWGRDKVLRRAALVGVAGILLIIFAPALFAGFALYLAWIAAALWGVGVALAFPLFLSAAGEGTDSARRVALVATCGYASFLVGPPLLGLLGQSIGLLGMFWVLAGCLILAAVLARTLRPSALTS